MNNIEKAVKKLVEGGADRDFIVDCAGSETELYGFYNSVALRIGKAFLDGELSFEEADGAINDLNVIWTGDPALEDFPEPGYSVYLAFDEGEYSIDGKDHIELYTKPGLRELLD